MSQAKQVLPKECITQQSLSRAGDGVGRHASAQRFVTCHRILNHADRNAVKAEPLLFPCDASF